VLAELAAAGLLLARRALGGALVPVVDVLGPVDLLDLLVELADLRRGLHAGDLLVELGGALRAQTALGVPAHLLADPLAAPVALVDVALHPLGRLLAVLVAGGAAVAVAHPLRVPADLRRLLTDRAAEQVAAHPQQPAAEAGNRVLERGGVSVAAPLAVELELV